MDRFPKQAVQKLTPEAQAEFASLMLARARRRAQKLDRVRHFRGRSGIPQVTMALLFLAFVFGNVRGDRWQESLVPLLMATIVYACAQIQINGINRRVDALIDLLEPELRGGEAMDERGVDGPVPSPDADSATPAGGSDGGEGSSPATQ